MYCVSELSWFLFVLKAQRLLAYHRTPIDNGNWCRLVEERNRSQDIVANLMLIFFGNYIYKINIRV